MTSSKTYIVNDQATEIDALDFMPYVETLADIIQTGNTPLTIGVFGTWGSGKTSLMKMIRRNTDSEYKGLPNDLQWHGLMRGNMTRKKRFGVHFCFVFYQQFAKQP